MSTDIGGNGRITPSGATILEGGRGTFRVTPDAGYELSTISGCGGVLSGNTYTTGPITADCTVAATFNLIALTVSTSAGANGTITPASSLVNWGSVASYTITPDAGYAISTVSGCDGTLTNDTYTTGTITADCTVTATFDPVVLTVSTVAGANGTITPASSLVNWGSVASYAITPDAGYAISTVSGCSGTLTHNTYPTVVITNDCTVTVDFLPTYTVSTSVGGGGQITPTSATVMEGESTSFAISPDANYEIVSVDGCSGTLSGNVYTIGATFTDCTVAVSFRLLLPEVAGLYSNNGANWNDYVKNDGATRYTATDTAADGSETGGYSALLHGGEFRSFAVTNRNGCADLTAQDDLGAFEWVCLENAAPVTMVSSGLKPGKHLSDLIDFSSAEWKPNRVTVYDGVSLYGRTPLSAWWDNPVIVDNDGSDGMDMSEGDIRVITTGPNATYTIGANKVALVAAPAVTLTGPTASGAALVAADSLSYLWIEGTLDATGYDAGLDFAGVNFSMMRNLNALNAVRGISLNNGANNNEIIQVTAENNTIGISLEGSSNTAVTQSIAQRNLHGVVLTNSSHSSLSEISASNNSGVGIRVHGAMSNNNTIRKITAINNGGGMGLSEGSRNVVSRIMVANSETTGFSVSGHSNTVSQVTVAGNQSGIIIGGTHNAISRITATNNDGPGIQSGIGAFENVISLVAASNNKINIAISFGTNLNFDDLVSTDADQGIVIAFSSDNIFSGILMTGNIGSAECTSIDSTNPGLNNDCTPQGGSSFSLITDATLANSFVGKIFSDDTNNQSDNAGSASYPLGPHLFDWINFENDSRGWGNDGSAFPATDQLGQWVVGTGRIWDWSLLSTDAVIRDALTMPDGNDARTHTWGDSSTTIYLDNAMEIQGDGIGNENGLCESSETCLYTPNIGSYQGHGALISAGAFSDGILTDITLLKYETNGR